MRRLLFIITVFACSFLAITTTITYAQVTSSDVGKPIIIESEQEPQLGDLVCTGRGGYVLCDQDYDTSMFGVVSTLPAAAFEAEPAENQHLVVTSGKTIVRVSGAGGAIRVGDLVTSSNDPGLAQKATRNGYVLGMAQEEFDPQNPTDTTTLLVSLNIHPTTIFIDVRNNLLQALREGLASPVLTPLAALRYILAALVTISSFILGFIFFGRVANTGVEAIGRNPMARLQIQTTIVVNLILTIIIFAIGIGLSYFILVL